MTASPRAIEFLHCLAEGFCRKILPGHSLPPEVAIASTWQSDYLNFLQNHQSPVSGLGEGRGWKGVKFLSLAADSFLLRKWGVKDLTFLLLFSLTSYTSKCIWQPFSEHWNTCLKGETSSGNGFYTPYTKWPRAHIRGEASGMEETRLWNELEWTVCREEENADIPVWGVDPKKGRTAGSQLASHCPGAFPAAIGPSPQMHSQLENFPCIHCWNCMQNAII